jgi:DNA-binding transcriptional regulator YiaG
MTPRTEELIAEIEKWCAQKRGRQSELARTLGIKRQTVQAWIRRERRPTTEQALAIIELLENQRSSAGRGGG